VPDSGGWALNVTGGGKDRLTVKEGEPAGPLSYAFGHTFFPGGVPCVVRDPNDRGGGISFSRHPDQETRVCYPGGFDEVAVKAADGAVSFTVLDTEPGVALRISGGAGDDELSEAANVPSSVEEFHNPESPVHFWGGGGTDYLTLDDGPAKSPATYTVGNGAIRKTGLPPLFFDKTVESLILYPQDGPSAIVVGRTGGTGLQVFGGFFRQAGPDDIDASASDGPLFVTTGSTGDDTIKGSVFQDYLDGGGGNDKIDSRDAIFDQVFCNGGSGAVNVDTLDMVNDCPSGKASPPQTALWRAAFTPRKVKRGKRLTLDTVSTLPGKVALKFKRAHARATTKTVSVKQGPDTVSFKPPRKLVKGKYAVSAVLRAAGGKKSKAVKLKLTVR
jgi:Ca2+-binding RTX toxin-like protein